MVRKYDAIETKHRNLQNQRLEYSFYKKKLFNSFDILKKDIKLQQKSFFSICLFFQLSFFLLLLLIGKLIEQENICLLFNAHWHCKVLKQKRKLIKVFLAVFIYFIAFAFMGHHILFSLDFQKLEQAHNLKWVITYWIKDRLRDRNICNKSTIDIFFP